MTSKAPEPLERIAVDEPTMSLLFTINTSPFLGKDGDYLTSRHIRERLDKSSRKTSPCASNPPTARTSGPCLAVGILHLSVLIETMRREGYEMQIGKPQVIFKEIDGARTSPLSTWSSTYPRPMPERPPNLS